MGGMVLAIGHRMSAFHTAQVACDTYGAKMYAHDTSHRVKIDFRIIQERLVVVGITHKITYYISYYFVLVSSASWHVSLLRMLQHITNAHTAQMCALLQFLDINNEDWRKV